MIIQTQNPRTPIESTNATSCANIFAPFCVFKKRNRFFSVAFFGLYGGAGVLSFGQKCKNVRLYVPSSVGMCFQLRFVEGFFRRFLMFRRRNARFVKTWGLHRKCASARGDFDTCWDRNCSSLVMTKIHRGETQISMVFCTIGMCVFFLHRGFSLGLSLWASTWLQLSLF